MQFDTIQPDPEIGAVVCGFDVSKCGGFKDPCRLTSTLQMKINYKKLGKAYSNLLHNPDCLFIMTNDGV